MKPAFTLAVAFGLVIALSAVARADITLLNQFANGGAGNIPHPLNVSAGPAGQVVVTDFVDSVGKIYAADGSYQANLTGAGSPINVGIDQPTHSVIGTDGKIYVSDGLREGVNVFGANGAALAEIALHQLTNAGGIALNSTGTLYVMNGNVVNLMTTAGVITSSFGSSGSAAGQFSGNGFLSGLALDPAGANVYVPDFDNNRVEIFSSSGVYESTFGTSPGPGQLLRPQGIAISGTGFVYLADANAGVKIYSPNGNYLSTVAANLGSVSDVAIGSTGMVYFTNVFAAYRYFDPTAWAAGTNTFTNANTGPTSVAVGSGQLLGSSFTLDSTKGLVVGATTSVNTGGIFTVSGGSLTTNNLTIDGTTGGANFTMTSGVISTNGVAVNSGGVADFAGPLTESNVGAVSVTGGASQFKVEQGAIVSATNLTNTGGQVVLGSSGDLIVFNNTSNGGTVNVAGGELDIRGTLANPSGSNMQVSGTLSTTGGLTNGGTMQISGNAQVLGNLTNSSVQIS